MMAFTRNNNTLPEGRRPVMGWRMVFVLCFLSTCLASNSGVVKDNDDNASTNSIINTNKHSTEKHLAVSSSFFDGWLTKHDKSYSSPQDYQRRFQIFQENYQIVQRHNRAYQLGYTSYAMTIDNPFADMTDDEFASLYLMDSQNCSATMSSSGKLKPNDMLDDVPKSIDWRTKGVITPVKNQHHCGSCWTFSTTGCLESHTCIQAKAARRHDNKEEDFECTSWTGLAEQQLVDCAGDFNNNGCHGGLPSQAFEYIKYTGGIDLETTYPYEGNETGVCLSSLGQVGAQVAEVFNITTRDEEDLEYAVAAIGPVSIAYQVASDFRHYHHGIYDSFNATTNTTTCKNTPEDVNHAVVAVGLGMTEAKDDKPSQPYYIVRNSWGTSWGMEGYFWMLRGENLCGVSDCASFPLVPTNVPSADKKTHLENAIESAKAIL